MKKQYLFPVFLMLCLSVCSGVRAQNNPIEVFLKKYPSREGITYVSVSKQMLQPMFSTVRSKVYFAGENPEAPDAYYSISVSKTENLANMTAEFEKIVAGFKYEQVMERNNENSEVLSYFLKKTDETTNEIIVFRKQKDQFSAIYLSGKVSIGSVDAYLRTIRSNLRTGAGVIDHAYAPGANLAFNLPSGEEGRFYAFDGESLHRNMQEVEEATRRQAEEAMKSFEQSFDKEALQRDMNKIMEEAKEHATETMKSFEHERTTESEIITE